MRRAGNFLTSRGEEEECGPLIKKIKEADITGVDQTKLTGKLESLVLASQVSRSGVRELSQALRTLSESSDRRAKRGLENQLLQSKQEQATL